MRTSPEAMAIAQAVTPGIVFLVLAQWSLVAFGLAQAARHRPGSVAWGGRLAELVAPATMSAALATLLLMPGDGMGPWRAYLLVGIPVVCFCWGRLALLPRPGDRAAASIGHRRAIKFWSFLARFTHAILFALAIWWFCHWFAARHCVKIHLASFFPMMSPGDEAGLQEAWLGLPTQFLFVTVFLNRFFGALLLVYLAMGAMLASRPTIFLHRTRRLCARVAWLAALRLIVMAGSLALGMATEPLGAWFFFHSLDASGLALLAVRVVLGVVLVGSQAVLGLEACRRGDPDGAARLFPQALIMCALGEILGAGLTIALLGLGL
jgi:hypothetical protein